MNSRWMILFLGRKSGKGCFVYGTGQKVKPVNSDAVTILEKYKTTPPAPLVDEDSQMRLVGRFVNEAVLCLQENILDNPVCLFIFILDQKKKNKGLFYLYDYLIYCN